MTPLVEATNSFLKSNDPFLHPHLKFQAVKVKKGGSVDQNKSVSSIRRALSPLFEVRELIYEEGSSINDTEARRFIIHDLVQQVVQVLQEGKIGTEPVKPEEILPFS